MFDKVMADADTQTEEVTTTLNRTEIMDGYEEQIDIYKQLVEAKDIEKDSLKERLRNEERLTKTGHSEQMKAIKQTSRYNKMQNQVNTMQAELNEYQEVIHDLLENYSLPENLVEQLQDLKD